MSEPGLRLVPVGTGAAFGAPEEAQSCYLVRAGRRTVVVDLGSGTLNRLARHVAPHEIDLLVITHLHPDHCVDLLALRVYMAWGPGAGRRVRVLGPPGLRERLVDFSGSEGWDAAFAFDELPAGHGEVALGDGLVLRHREVPHLPPTHAIRLDRGGASVCLGADCAPNDALPALADDCDVVVMECTFGAEEGPADVPHLGARDAAAMASRARARRLLLTHCPPDVDHDAALRLARQGFAGPVAWARPGEEVAA